MAHTNKLLLSLVALVLLLLLHVAPTHQNAVKWRPQTSADAVDLFWRYIGQEGSQLGPVSARKTMQQAAQSGLTYLRVAAMGFWPNDMRLFQTNATQYWELYGQFVSDARAAGVRLVPSILWNSFTLADLMGAPLGTMFEPGSPLNSALMSYTRQVVSRHASDPTILMWELGNEKNLLADLDLAQQQPAICVPCGTPARRTQLDNFTTDMLMDLQTQMVSEIRAIDTLNRPISTGNSVPRPDAEHLRASYYKPHRDWSNDTQEQFATNLLDVNKATDTINVHYYSHSVHRWNFTTDTQLLELIHDIATAANKSLYVGEFGQPIPLNATDRSRPFNEAVLDTIVQRCIPYSTVWVFEFPNQPTFSITVANDTQYLQHTAQVNAQLRQHCST